MREASGLEEKGVDVAVALAYARLAGRTGYDLVILAAHDTNQLPALEYALSSGRARRGEVLVETVGWKGASA